MSYLRKNLKQLPPILHKNKIFTIDAYSKSAQGLSV